LLDSGLDPGLECAVIGSCRFGADDSGAVVDLPTLPDPTGHGSTVARIILAQAPAARLLNAQVFSRPGATSPAIIARGLDWLVERNATLVNMSFGLRHDRRVLRQACECAIARGVILLAATPARGPRIYPSSYQGVIRVTGDARCHSHEISHLATAQADYGACPGGPEHSRTTPERGGASHAAAHLTGLIAAHLADGGSTGTVARWLRARACHHGPERRSAARGRK
jgi:hypothetical protein